MSVSNLPTKIEKCKGAMIATAIGDALGWPHENRANNISQESESNDGFVEWIRHCGRPYWHNEKIMRGEYSDDTQLTLSVARSIIAGNSEDMFAKKELPFWLEYERGGGRALLNAAKSCKKGVMMWRSKYSKEYFDAGGNGGAMRVLPYVIALSNLEDADDELMKNVIRNCVITHGHPRAILGATCYAFALNYLLRKEDVLEYGELISVVMNGVSVWGALPYAKALDEWNNSAKINPSYEYDKEWATVCDSMINQLGNIKISLKKGLMLDTEKVLEEIGCFTKIGGAGDIAVLAAIYLLSKYANNPTLGIKSVAFLNGVDTDTIASMTGGLMGMLCGTNWIPSEWRLVQDYNCLEQITELLLSENKKEASQMLVADVKGNNIWENSPIGLMKKLKAFKTDSNKNATVIITKYQSALGQTMYLKKYKNNEDRQYQYEQISINRDAEKPKEETVFLQDTRGAYNKFVLSQNELAKLINEPLVRKKTFGKILEIINALLSNTATSNDVAKQFRVEREVVEIINQYII